MHLELSDPVHVAKIDDDLVLLDVLAETYFCLPLPAGLVALEGRRLLTQDEALGDELVSAGLARWSGQAQAAARTPPTPPTRTARRQLDLSPGLAAPIRPAHLFALIAAIRAGRASRRLSFHALIQAHGQAPPAPRRDEAVLLADLAVWRRLAPWTPLDGVCFFRSGMLAVFLQALGHRPTWVFGVRTWPFQAHCWLQVGDMALDDEHERLCAYAPILGA